MGFAQSAWLEHEAVSMLLLMDQRTTQRSKWAWLAFHMDSAQPVQLCNILGLFSLFRPRCGETGVMFNSFPQMIEPTTSIRMSVMENAAVLIQFLLCWKALTWWYILYILSIVDLKPLWLFALISWGWKGICARNVGINGSAFLCFSCSHLKPYGWKAPGKECVQCSELFYRTGIKCAEQHSLILLSVKRFLLRYILVEHCFLFVY